MKNIKNRTSTFRIDRNQLKIFLILNDFYQILQDCRQPFLKWGNRTSRQATSLPIILSFFFLSLGILQLSFETRNDSLLKNYPLLSHKIYQKFETFYLQLLEDKKNILEKNVLLTHEKTMLQNNDCPCEKCIRVKNFGEYLTTSTKSLASFDHQKDKVIYFYKTFNQLRDKLLEEMHKAQKASQFGEKLNPIELYCLVPESYVHKYVHEYEDWIKNQSYPLMIDIHPSHFKKIQIRYPKNLCIETTPIWFQSFFHKTINESFVKNISKEAFHLNHLYHVQKTSDQIPRKIEGFTRGGAGHQFYPTTRPEKQSYLSPNWDGRLFARMFQFQEFLEMSERAKTIYLKQFKQLIKKFFFFKDQLYNGKKVKIANHFFIKKLPNAIKAQNSFSPTHLSIKEKKLSNYFLSYFRGFDWKDIEHQNIYKINCLDKNISLLGYYARNFYNVSWFWDIEDPSLLEPYLLDRPFSEENSYIIQKSNLNKSPVEQSLLYMEMKDMLHFSKFQQWMVKKSHRSAIEPLVLFKNQNLDFNDSYNIFVPEDYLLESLYWYIKKNGGFKEILKGIQENNKKIQNEKGMKTTEDLWKNLAERFELVRKEYLNWIQEFLEGKHPYWKEPKSFDNKFSQIDKSLKYLLNFLKLRKNKRRQFLKICKKKIPIQTLLNSKRKIQFVSPISYYKKNVRSESTMDAFLKHCDGLDLKNQQKPHQLHQYLLKLKAEALKKQKGLKKKKDKIKESKLKMANSGFKPAKESNIQKSPVVPSHSYTWFELELMKFSFFVKELLKDNTETFIHSSKESWDYLNFLFRMQDRNLQKTYDLFERAELMDYFPKTPQWIREALLAPQSLISSNQTATSLEYKFLLKNFFEPFLIEKQIQAILTDDLQQMHFQKNVDLCLEKKNQTLKKEQLYSARLFNQLKSLLQKLRKVPLQVALNCDDFYDEIRHQIEKIDPSFLKNYYKRDHQAGSHAAPPRVGTFEVTVFKTEKFQKKVHPIFQLMNSGIDLFLSDSTEENVLLYKPYHTFLTRKVSGYLFADWDFQYISTKPKILAPLFPNCLEKWQVFFSVPQVPMNIQDKIGIGIGSRSQGLFQSLEVLRDIGQKNKKTKSQTNLLKVQEQSFQPVKAPIRLFEFYEKLSPYSWSIFFALSSGWFFMNVFRDLYKKYAKEILESCIDYIHRAGMIEKKDVEWIKEELGLMPVNIAYRGIRHQGKKLSSITGMDHLSTQINEMVHFLKTQKCISRQFLIFKILDFWRNLCLECLEPSVKKQLHIEKEQKERFKTKGFLFVGPPGTGKTLLVQAIAGETGVPVVTQSGGLLQNPREKRRGARTLHKLFLRAREIAPCIVFIDEIDGVGKRRLLQPLFHDIHGQYDFVELLETEGLPPPEYIPYEKMHVSQRRREDFFDDTHRSMYWKEPEFTQTIQTTRIPIEVLEDVQSSHAERNEQVSILTQLLIELDGIRSLEKILVIGATNRLEILDPALMRPGRFQQILKISLPDYEGRINLLKFYIDKIHVEKQMEKISWDYFAKRTHGFSSADIASVVFASELTAIQQGGGHTSKTLERGLDLITSYTRDPLKDRFQKISNFYEQSLENFGNFFYFCENIQTQFQNHFVVEWIGSFRHLPTKVFSKHDKSLKALRFQLIPIGQKQSRLGFSHQRNLKVLPFKPTRRELLRRKFPIWKTFSFRIPTSFQFYKSLKV